MVKYFASLEDFDLEISPEVQAAVDRLQQVVPNDEVFLHLFVMISVLERMLDFTYEESPELFDAIMDKDASFVSISEMIYNKADYIFERYQEEEND